MTLNVEYIPVPSKVARVVLGDKGSPTGLLVKNDKNPDWVYIDRPAALVAEKVAIHRGYIGELIEALQIIQEAGYPG